MAKDDVGAKKEANQDNDMNNQGQRQVILVLGMHRSGTSALTGMLVKLGVEPPKNLMAPNKNNPTGYWESQLFYNFHERLLESAGSNWHDWGIFNPFCDAPHSGDSFEAEWEKLFIEEYGDSSLFAVKDPRMCRFVPFWLKQLKRACIEPKVVLIYRNPIEVAASLKKRNSFTTAYSYLLWLRHILDAEEATRDITRSIVCYSDLLTDWRGVAEKLSSDLDLKWPKWSRDVEKDTEEFIRSDLRRNEAANEDVFIRRDVFEWVKSTYQILHDLRSQNVSEELFFDQLDQVKGEFDKASVVFGYVIAETEVDAKKLTSDTFELKRNLKQIEKIIYEKDIKLKELEVELDSNRKKNNEYEKEVLKLSNWIRQLKAEFNKLLTSNRWKIGNTIVNFLNLFRLKKQSLPAIDQANKIFDNFEYEIQDWQKETQHGEGYTAEDLEYLKNWLEQLDHNINKLFKSKRWKMSSLIGSVVSFIRGRGKKPRQVYKIEEVIENYRSWKQQGNDESTDINNLLSWIVELEDNYKVLINSKRWKIADKIFSFTNSLLFRSQSKEPTKLIAKLLLQFNQWQEESAKIKQTKISYFEYCTPVSPEEATGETYKLLPPYH